MVTFISTAIKYLFILLMIFYTWESFSALRCRLDPYRASGVFQRQNGAIFATYLLGIITIFMNQTDTSDINVIILGGVQMCYLIVVLGIFPIIYPSINKAVLSNMCMLLTIGFIIQARLDFEKSIRQFIIVAVVTMTSLIVPYLLSHFKMWKSFTWGYCVAGLFLLLAVLLIGTVSGGANLSIDIGSFTFQPSEFVKILFVFFVAGMFSKSTSFRQILISAIAAGAHVLILVLSNDLGSALIMSMIYVFMLYVGTRKLRYLAIGFVAMAAASLLAYRLFSHVQTRVEAWLDPWSIIDGKGYQITQSLFAIGSGGLTGTGLYQGRPLDIPVVTKDFVFSAIGEEFGGIFAVLLILVCLGCFVAFLTTAMSQTDMFYKLVCVGLGVSYAVQVILTIGGALKMIPSTGVTLPLISYGGSSILSTLISFAILQGMAIVGTKSDEAVQKRRLTEDGKNAKTGNKTTAKRIEHTQEIKPFK